MQTDECLMNDSGQTLFDIENITDLDEVNPSITGPSGAAGNATIISIEENATAVHTFTADETVTWS